MIVNLFRRHRAAHALSADQRYFALIAELRGIWQELYQVADPEQRAVLVDQAATLTGRAALLVPEAHLAEGWRMVHAHAYNTVLLEHYAATERAIHGELALPTEPAGSVIGHHPDAVLLWVELASTTDRARRAAVLIQLSATLGALIGPDVAETLTTLADTENRLARVLPRPRRGWPHPADHRMAVITVLFIAALTLPLLLGWSRSDRTAFDVGALAIEMYAVLLPDLPRSTQAARGGGRRRAVRPPRNTPHSPAEVAEDPRSPRRKR